MSRVSLGRVVFMIVLLWCVPARAQEIDPALEADIEHLFHVIGIEDAGPRIATAAASQFITNLRAQQPQIPERVGEVVKDVFAAEFTRAFAADSPIHADMVRSYAMHFTRAEIAAMVAFYTTDVGRKAVSLLPQLSQEGMAAGQRWAAANMSRILGVLQERLRAEGLAK